MKSITSRYISGISWAGAIQEHKNLAILPLLSKQAPKAHYIGLNEAIEKDQIKITEVDEGGSVPTLIAINKGSIPILLLQGEEVEGAYQNRVFNTTIMLKEHSKTMIPVSCTEAGRWSYRTSRNSTSVSDWPPDPLLRNGFGYRGQYGGWICGTPFVPRWDSELYRSRFRDADTSTEGSENEEPDMPSADDSTNIADGFETSQNIMPVNVRTMILDSVSDNLDSDNSYESDQSGVWNEVNILSRKADVQSSTSAINDVFTEKDATLSEYADAFHCLPGQQGALVFLNGKVQSLDIFSNETAYEGYQEKLIKSYAMEAMVAEESTNQKPSYELGKSFIQKAACSDESRHSSVGIGHDYRLQGSDLIGSALVHDKEVLQITLLSLSN